MTEGRINERVVMERASWVLQMIEALHDLPIENREAFFQNRHNIAAAESYLRRALEALFDLGRHILAKEFAYPATEYKEIAGGLLEKKVMSAEDSGLMRQMAGYRIRMVHFYHEVTPEELYDICSNHLHEIRKLLDQLMKWVREQRGLETAQ
jgi:uncharacterized protein YutE (UPF0331/DUF86 family)